MATKKKSGVLLSAADIKRRYPDSGLASVIALQEDKVLRLPSRILALNHQIGGGIPYGKIMETFGEESTGKSLLAMDFAKVCQDLGGVVLWNDAEASWSNSWAELNGLDLNRVEVLRDENVIEVISDWISDLVIYWRNKLTNNEPILLVGDSIAAWDTQMNMDTADTDSGEDMGRRSKKIYQMLRKRRKILSKYGVCSFFINQVRKKVGASKFEDPDTTPGGMAMRFYADIRLGLYRGKALKEDDNDSESERIGQKVYMRVRKNKVAPPRRNIDGKVYFREFNGQMGFNKYEGLGETLVRMDIIERKHGGTYTFGNDVIARGDKQLDKLLIKNAEVRKQLLAETSINTPSKLRAQIKGIEKNLYPVKLKTKSDE